MMSKLQMTAAIAALVLNVGSVVADETASSWRGKAKRIRAEALRDFTPLEKEVIERIRTLKYDTRVVRSVPELVDGILARDPKIKSVNVIDGYVSDYVAPEQLREEINRSLSLVGEHAVIVLRGTKKGIGEAYAMLDEPEPKEIKQQIVGIVSPDQLFERALPLGPTRKVFGLNPLNDWVLITDEQDPKDLTPQTRLLFELAQRASSVTDVGEYLFEGDKRALKGGLEFLTYAPSLLPQRFIEDAAWRRHAVLRLSLGHVTTRSTYVEQDVRAATDMATLLAKYPLLQEGVVMTRVERPDWISVGEGALELAFNPERLHDYPLGGDPLTKGAMLLARQELEEKLYSSPAKHGWERIREMQRTARLRGLAAVELMAMSVFFPAKERIRREAQSLTTREPGSIRTDAANQQATKLSKVIRQMHVVGDKLVEARRAQENGVRDALRHPKP